MVTRVSDTHVPDEAYAEARATFTEKQLADLTIAVGVMNAYNRLAISFRARPLAAASAAAAVTVPSRAWSSGAAAGSTVVRSMDGEVDG